MLPLSVSAGIAVRPSSTEPSVTDEKIEKISCTCSTVQYSCHIFSSQQHWELMLTGIIRALLEKVHGSRFHTMLQNSLVDYTKGMKLATALKKPQG